MQKQQSEEYNRLVLDEVKSYEALAKPVKTCLLMRLIIKKTDIDNLHPNPKDEFSDPAIGPNYEIVSRYADDIRKSIGRSFEPFENPLEVVKMSTGGYMILNGHHRWYAAIRMGLPTMPIHITNIATNEEIIETVKRSERKKAVSFDLDEVLLTDGVRVPRDRRFFWPLSKVFPETLRLRTTSLIRELHREGYDVWVYTGSYRTAGYIRELFFLHGTKVDGVVNGMKHSDVSLQEVFRAKYETILHIDNESVTRVCPGTKEYEVLELHADGHTWASEAMKAVKGMAQNGTK